MTTEQAFQAEETYKRRQARAEHPDGSFDKAGRWFPSTSEQRACCQTIRTPSRRWAYSLMLHCRTRKHVRQLVLGATS